MSEAIEWQSARELVLKAVRPAAGPFQIEQVDLLQAHGRVLAQDVAADRDIPALRRSLRDGFAVYAADVPGTLKVQAETRAGEPEAGPLARGEAREIMTGAPLPPGADAVVMVEHVTRHTENRSTSVKIDRSAEPGQWINEQGAEAKKGNVMLRSGTRLDAAGVATLAMTGYSSVPVFVRPVVAILATGDEIVELGEEPESHQIRNSNSYMLAALVTASGGVAKLLPIARDTREALRPLLERGLQHDMLIVTGGVSAGRYDLVKPALRELGVEFHFERVRIQPGGPCAFGTVGGKPVFGLPGNPGSTYVTFQLFAEGALALISGVAEPILPLLTARFSAEFHHRPGLTRFLPARLESDGETLTHIRWQGSSDVPALARANAFLIADHYRETWEAGDSIRVLRKL